jgi:membrane protease YdiL (CAAX protease family)
LEPEWRLATLKNVEIEEQFIESPFGGVPPHDDAVPAPVIPTPNDPSWNALEAVAVWVVSVLLILIVPVFFLLPYVALQNPPITGGEQLAEFAKSDSTAIILQIAAIIPAHVLTLVLVWLVVTRVRKYSFRQTLGWANGGFAWWYYGIILVAFFITAAVVGSFFPEQEHELIRILRSSRSAVYIVAFVATFTAPLVEELVYRGVLYSAFQRKFGISAAFILVTVLFALVHVPQYYPSYSTIFLLTLLSLTLTAVRVKSGNLFPCIVLHTLFNGIQSVLLVAEPLVNTTTRPETSATILQLLK